MTQASHQRPIERLADALRRFIRQPTLRLLYVEADTRLRAAAEQTIVATEHFAGNLSPMLHARFSAADDRDAIWEAATDALRHEHESRREAGSPLAPLAHRPLTTQGSANFAAQVLQCLGTVRSPAEGLLLFIVSPSSPPTPQWLKRVGETIGNHRLQGARFVCLLAPAEHAAPWLATLEKGTYLHQICAVDPAEAIRELEAEVDAEEQLGSEYRGAWPRGVRPPPRRPAFAVAGATQTSASGPGPTSTASSGAEIESSAGAQTGVGGSAASPAAEATASPTARTRPRPPSVDDQLRIHVQRAAIALAKTDGPECIRHQAAARDLCLAQGRTEDAIGMELILGTYLARLGQQNLAVATFDQAAARAESVEAWALAAQGHLASGSTSHSAGDTTKALASFRQGIGRGRQAERVELVFQAYWEAGQIALGLNLELDCIALWGDAFAYAREFDVAKLRGTMAKEVISGLAQLLARYRRFADAREVERAAQAFTNG